MYMTNNICYNKIILNLYLTVQLLELSEVNCMSLHSVYTIPVEIPF